MLLQVSKGAPAYFRGMNKEQKSNVVNEWALAFVNEDFKIVSDSVSEFFKKGSKLAPFPSEIQKIIDAKKAELRNVWEKRWYEHFPDKGLINYCDKDVEWAEWEDWNNMPLELSKRMKYVPDPNDEERNKFLAQCLEIQRSGKLERGTI